jgi:hypothetical protein
MENIVPESGDRESDQLKQLLFEFIPRRLWGLLTDPNKTKAEQLLMLFLLLFATGFGYLYGMLRWR